MFELFDWRDLSLPQDPESFPTFFEYLKNESDFIPIESHGMGAISPPSPKVERINTIAPMPFLKIGRVANAFRTLKQSCIDGAGFDFLEKCADVMRHKDFQSNKPGVASKSFHKCGVAFDYNQAETKLIVVSEPIGSQQYFHTWLKCAKQDGTQGIKLKLRDIRGFYVHAWVWDFTSEAERLGWKRVRAWSGWQNSYTKKEFWHYELTEGKSFDELMNYLYGSPSQKILKRGDSGEAVKSLQEDLILLCYLKPGDNDGQFGPATEKAVKKFQADNGLVQDGKVGPATLQELDRLLVGRISMSENIEDEPEAFDYDVNEINTLVASEEEDNITADPWYKTSQFKMLLALYVLGPLSMFLVHKKIILPEQTALSVSLFYSVVVFVIGLAHVQFMKSRGEVSAIKANAAAINVLSQNSSNNLDSFNTR